MKDDLGVAGTNLTRAKLHNRRAVFEAVRLRGSLTRAEIARLTALTPQTVSNIVADLQASGILDNNDPVRGGRGQPATPLSINPDGAYSVGFQIDFKSIVGVCVDLSGRVRGRVEVPTRQPTPQEAMPQLVETVERLKRVTNIDWREVLGAGLAIPGPFNVEGLSSVGPTALPGWWDEAVSEHMAAAIGMPVIIENDANAAAIAERLYGVARALRSFVYLFVGNGLGAGVFLDGHLHKGTAGNSGEIGHMIVVPGGKLCACSNRGCLERYISLSSAYEALGLDDPETMTPDVLLRPDAQRAQLVEAWLDAAAGPLRQAVNILESILDADAIVIGGLLPEPLIERLIARLEPLAMSVAAGRGPMQRRVLVGTAGHDTAALGAAALPIFGEFNPQYDVLLKSHAD